jgi:acetyltransferase-like isoleucine patch superfamily enzyme
MNFKSIFLSGLSIFLILMHFIFLKFIIRKNKVSFGNHFFPFFSKINVKGSGNHIYFGQNVKIKKTKINLYGSNNKLYLESGVRVYDSCEFLIEGDNCEIYIGKNTTIGSANIFCGESDTKIIIGDNCLLSRKINIDTSDFHSIIDLNTNTRINPPKDVIIRDRVWVGYNVSINKGSVLGSNSMVAIKSVVSGKKFPDNVVIGGVPAKIIKENITWCREKLPY